ncbi:MAG TPA: carboxypeptidase-like regulatory domain-containing protein [Bryobacteraceae bacterium]|nr:carboxypeptidase-like regulatory domain-containing protein [Bryobacteraceae bacterium]
MRKTRKKRRKKTGINRRGAILRGFLLPVVIASAAVAIAGLHPFWRVAAAGKHQKDPGEYAIVAGTVFREPGFSLPGAEVTIAPVLPEGSHQKVKKLKTISSPRGEFAFHVPPGPMQYTLSVTCKGFQPEEKTTSIEAGERVDINFVLQQESKRK